MEREQIMARMLAEMKAEKAGKELLKEEMVAKMETNQQRIEDNEEKMMARTGS
jgi:hypothetical protein